MRTIPVGKHNVIVDDWNYDLVRGLKYLVATSGVVGVKWSRTSSKVTPLSKILYQTDAPMIDHKDRNWLNNQVANFRPCNRSQNQANHGKHRFGDGSPSTSRYKGVSWSDRDRLWAAAVGKGKSRKRGTFHDEIEAALAYDRWATERWGEFACLNFPPTAP